MSESSTFKMRQSDVINIIIGLCYVGLVIWLMSGLNSQVNANSTWIETNKDCPTAVVQNTKWIKENHDIPDAVLTSTITVDYLQKSIDRLSEQVKLANKNFKRLNGNLSRQFKDDP